MVLYEICQRAYLLYYFMCEFYIWDNNSSHCRTLQFLKFINISFLITIKLNCSNRNVVSLYRQYSLIRDIKPIILSIFYASHLGGNRSFRQQISKLFYYLFLHFEVPLDRITLFLRMRVFLSLTLFSNNCV